MNSPNPLPTASTASLTLTDFQRICDVMEGYMDLGLSDVAATMMRKLTSELGLSEDEVAPFMNVLTKTTRPPLPAAGEDKPAEVSFLQARTSMPSAEWDRQAAMSQMTSHDLPPWQVVYQQETPLIMPQRLHRIHLSRSSRRINPKRDPGKN